MTVVCFVVGVFVCVARFSFKQLKDSIHIVHPLYATNVAVYDSVYREIILK